MISEAPPFWWSPNPWQATALAPLGWIYGRVALRRMENAPRVAASVPVVCVGNFTVGGAGKTPTALALAAQAEKRGIKPGFLSRGHGGSLGGTVLVDPGMHGPHEVGDEALLLARIAPTVVTRHRPDGARRLVEEGCGVVIMDDGFQSATLNFDYALLVVDGRRGLGNGRPIPAGPLRAPVVDQLRYADALLKIGDGEAGDRVVRQAARAAKPVYRAALKPAGSLDLKNRPVLAFAGIGDPEKFFRTVEAMGAEVRARRVFPDHHDFSEAEAEDLLASAEESGLTPVTTAKDMVRLAHGRPRALDLSVRAATIDIELVFEDRPTADTILNAAFSAFRKRRIAG